MSKITKALLCVSGFSAIMADVGAYVNVFTNTSHYEGNKKLSKFSITIAVISLIAATITSAIDTLANSSSSKDEEVEQHD